MTKDTTLRVAPKEAKLLAKIAKNEGRTMKKMFELIMVEYHVAHPYN
jgi:hypothetical protein